MRSIRKLLVVLLTVSPYLKLVYYTTGMANLKKVLNYMSSLSVSFKHVYINSVPRVYRSE